MKASRLLIVPVLVAGFTLPFQAFAAKGDKKKDHSPAAQFATFDKNNDGSVSEAEYVEAMKDKLGEDQAKKHFAELDKDHDGKLTKEELGAATEKKPHKKKKQQNS